METANACHRFEQVAGRRRENGTELWDLGTCKGYANGRCSRICPTSCLDSAVIVAELIPYPERGHSVHKFPRASYPPYRQTLRRPCVSTHVCFSSSPPVSPCMVARNTMSFLPLTDPGHAIIMIEADPFVADTTID
jgi:hypothetical protein